MTFLFFYDTFLDRIEVLVRTVRKFIEKKAHWRQRDTTPQYEENKKR